MGSKGCEEESGLGGGVGSGQCIGGGSGCHLSRQTGSQDRPESALKHLPSVPCLCIYLQACDCQKALLFSMEQRADWIPFLHLPTREYQEPFWHLNQNLKRLYYLLISRGKTISCGCSQVHALVQSHEWNRPGLSWGFYTIGGTKCFYGNSPLLGCGSG